jgi:hypothetical protein
MPSQKMDDKELLKNFKEIREGLENLSKMVFLIASQFYDFSGEESSGHLEKDITDIHPIKTNGFSSYIG